MYPAKQRQAGGTISCLPELYGSEKNSIYKERAAGAGVQSGGRALIRRKLLLLWESSKISLYFLLKLYNQKCKGMHKKCKLNGSKFGIIASVSRLLSVIFTEGAC